MEKTRLGIENGRATYAFSVVAEAVQNKKVNNKEYRSYVKKLPSLIQVNGLGQALAFCYQKQKEYRVIYDQIFKWLKQSHPQYFTDPEKEFVYTVVSLNSRDYRLLTMETLALLNWMRKFADGMINE